MISFFAKDLPRKNTLLLIGVRSDGDGERYIDSIYIYMESSTGEVAASEGFKFVSRVLFVDALANRSIAVEVSRDVLGNVHSETFFAGAPSIG